MALAARLVFCGFVVGWERPPSGDEIDYHYLAVNLTEGNGYRLENNQVTARRPPLFPLVLAGLYSVFGANTVLARLIQVLLGTLIVPLVFFATRRFFSERAAWIAGALAAVNPFLIFISAYLLTENLYIILLLCVLFAVPAEPHLLGSWRRAAVMGVLLGLGCLARPTAFFVVLWIVGWVVLLGASPLKNRIFRCAVLVGVVVLTLVPWTIRNHIAFDKTMFFTSHGGITFYQGNNAAVLEYPQYHGGVAPLHMLPGNDELKTLQEIAKDEKARALGREFLRENPGDIPILVWRKFARFWRFKSDVGLSGVKSGWWWNKDSFLGKLASSLDVGFVYAVFVIPLFVVGLIFSFKRRRWWVFLTGLIVMHTLVTLIFHGSLRMRIPIEPVIVMFAAFTIDRIFIHIRARFSGPQQD